MSIWSLVVGTLVLLWAAGALANEPLVSVGADLNTQRLSDGYLQIGTEVVSKQLRLIDNPQNNPTPDSTAETRGWVEIGRGLGSYSAIIGSIRNFKSGDESTLEANNTSYSSIPFSIQSDSLPAGTSVPVNLVIKLNGNITATGSSPGLNFADVTLSAEVTGPNRFYQGYFPEVGADPTAAAGFITIFGEPDPGAEQTLMDAITTRSEVGGISAAVDWLHTFRFHGVVGTEYSLHTYLSTHILVDEPSDVHFISDFYDSAVISLAAVDSTYRIVMVPEPGVISLLAVVGLLGLRRRR